MPELSTFADLHFLRPAWLWVLLPTFLLWLVLRRGAGSTRRWRKAIAPHLLEHLTVGLADRWRFRPRHLVLAVLVLGAVGAAGPTWEREASPFAEDTAPLVLALDVSRSMNAVDVQPTRLERAKQKVRDLLALRSGASTALIAYSGSAHTVLPLCDDSSIFEEFLAALATDVMPLKGKSPTKALTLAEELLAEEETPGSILFLTDGIAVDAAPAFAEHASRSADEVLVLAFGTSDGGPIRKGEDGFETEADGRRAVAALDVEGLQALREQAAIFVAGSTVDDADVRRVQRRVQSHLREVQRRDEMARWRDQGYWLTIPIALLGLLWFRKGWTVRWSALAALLVITSGCAGSDDTRFIDLWLTPDQQGRTAFEDGDYERAALEFVDPMWKGIALYRAGDLEGAADAFARVLSAEGAYNLGNAYAGLGRHEEAVAAYGAALAERPDWVEATENRDAVLALMPVQLDLDLEEEQASGEPSLPPDEIQFDEKGQQGQVGQIESEQLTDEQMAEMWLRRLQSSPADFLRQRFAVEAAAEEADVR